MTTGVLMLARASDLAMAGYACRCIPKEWTITLVVSSEDYGRAKQADVPADEIVISDFDRGGNLNGIGAILAIADRLTLLGEKHERVMKLDSDTLVFKPSELGDGLCGITHPKDPAGVMGLCYSMPSSVASRLRQKAEDWSGRGWNAVAEDSAIGAMALVLGAKDDRIHSTHLHWERYDGVTASPHHIFGHYRWREGAMLKGYSNPSDVNRLSLASMIRDYEVFNLKRRD